jgi:hypothetical protein
MDKLHASELFNLYVEGWKEKNINKIITSIDKDCVIVESHGPTYYGRENIHQWVNEWFDVNSIVIKWDIISFHYDSGVGFCEWNFTCIVNEKEYNFLGASIVKYKNDKIAYLHEYRMTGKPYAWEG